MNYEYESKLQTRPALHEVMNHSSNNMFLLEIERILITEDKDDVVTTLETMSNIEPYVEPVEERAPRNAGWGYLILVLILLLYLLISWYTRRMKKKQRERAEQAELERLASLKNRIAIKKFGTQDCTQSLDVEAQQKNTVNNPQECIPNTVMASKEELNCLSESSKSESDNSSFEIIKCGTEDDWQHTCAICYEQFNIEDDIGCSKNEKCCHYFHFNCILSWLIIDLNHNHCPMCRNVFVEDREGN